MLICFALNTFSQSKTDIKTKPICNGEQINKENIKNNGINPEFPGGLNKFYSFIKENYHRPKAKSLTGNVYICFIIEKDGSLTNIKVIRDIGYGTGKEAIRVLKKSPKWIPATQNSKPIRYLYPMAIQL